MSYSKDDPRSIFDAFMKLSELDGQREERRRKIQQLSAWSATNCGNCNRWMKSSECPAEVNVNGMNRGPSCADIRARNCKKFDRTKESAKAAADLAVELAVTP